MYYEERIIKGILYYRLMPDGNWKKKKQQITKNDNYDNFCEKESKKREESTI